MSSQEPFYSKLKHFLFGDPRDIQDTSIFHKITLIPVLAWIGLGADGLSSSCYGPEEAFRALGEHIYLAIPLALGTILTVAIISYCYSKIIEHFPHGGGGYVVASRTIGEKAGLLSGCALIVDYILTISVSIASCGDAIFSYVPSNLHSLKLPFEFLIILILIIINIRGVKESITLLTPIFIIFILSHLLLIGYGIFSHYNDFPKIYTSLNTHFNLDMSSIGLFGISAIFLHAFSLGGGTYTGIEAVSNGLQTLREPRVENGKRTMIYMAMSLAITASGLYICYLLLRLKPAEGATLNSILANTLYSNWKAGKVIALITIFSEAALLIVASQTGFLDGPRVIANMAVDSWFPHKFSSLSERLTLRNGILIFGISSLLILIYTKGSISMLIVMYSINVFITFTLSITGMAFKTFKNRRYEKKWFRDLSVEIIGALLCISILSITVFEKFTHGGWLTITITGALISLCYMVKSHYIKVRNYITNLDKVFMQTLKFTPADKNLPIREVDYKKPTAVQLVSDFNGLGVHTLLSIFRNFPNLYHNVIFVSVSVIDSGVFKGSDEIENLKKKTEESLKKYVNLANKLGFSSDYRYVVGTDVVECATKLCVDLSNEFSHITVFTGQITFTLEKFYHKLLHNETAFAIQRRLQMYGIMTVVLPVKIDTGGKQNE